MKKLFAFAWMLMFCVPSMGYEVGDCKSRAESIKGFFDEIPADEYELSYYIGGSSSVCIEIENNSTRPIRAIKWEGLQTQQIIDFRFVVNPNSKGKECQENLGSRIMSNTQASISAYEYGYRQGSCLDYYTEEDKERDLIYDGCMASKSKGATSASIRYIKKECRNIADDPSIFDKWRWGS